MNQENTTSSSDEQPSQTQQSDNAGFAGGVKIPPEAFYSVRRLRIIAVFMDWIIVFILSALFTMLAGILTIVTFGLASGLMAASFGITAILYSAFTLGGPHSATWGMRAMGITLISLEGDKITWPMAILHSLLFYVISITFLPLHLFSLLSPKKQLIHDFLLGTAIVRYPSEEDYE